MDRDMGVVIDVTDGKASWGNKDTVDSDFGVDDDVADGNTVFSVIFSVCFESGVDESTRVKASCTRNL
eukprot:1816480-Ditylum_brightwellii.AAC.1